MPLTTQYKDIKIIDVDSLIQDLEKLIEEDNYMYSLENKSKLIKSFIVLRLCNILFALTDSNRKFKLLYLINKKPELTLLAEYCNFVYNIFIKIAKILSFTYIIDARDFKEYGLLLCGDSGESKEARVKLYSVYGRSNKSPNFIKLKTLLERYNITSSKVLDNTFNIKLGLFIT